MNNDSQFYETINKKRFIPKYVAEVGVWHPNGSNIYTHIMNGIEAMLVEPDPKSIDLITYQFNKPNVTLHAAAVCDFEGEIELCQRGASTFVSHLPSSPALVNDGCNIEKSKSFMAKAVKFSNIDNGTIDLISIDIEGSEWFVIKNMISRPAVISIETHGGVYINHYIKQILQWMRENNYSLLYKDKSNSVYVKTETIEITVLDKLNLMIQEVFLFLNPIRKKIKKRLKTVLFSN